MALAEPFDLLSGFPGWVTGFEPRRRQEQSSQASGRVVVKDLGPPLWQLKAQSKLLSPNLLDYWRARLAAMEDGMATFLGYSLSRTYPIAYPRGSWPGSFDGVSAALSSVNVNRKAVRIASLPAGFVFSVGDYLSIAGDLHQVMETATASGAGLTPEFEVRPHLWPGVASGVVSLKKPGCTMSIVPGSAVSDAGLNGWGNISFQAIEARS